MSLCGEGGAALCWECEMVPSWAIHHHATYLRLLLGGVGRGGTLGGPRGARGGSANAGFQLEEGQDLNPHRSRGEALVRLSIPNLLRCLEFFFPDRRYLCRASQGFPFLRGEKLPYRICRGGEATCAWLACPLSLSAAAYYGNPTDALTLPPFPWGYTLTAPEEEYKRKGKKTYFVYLANEKNVDTGQSDSADETRCVRAKTAAVQTGPRGSHSCRSGPP